MAAARYDDPRYVRAYREHARKLPKFEYTRLVFSAE
jgi:hypothetical protein